MCGIAGVVDLDGHGRATRDLARAMAQPMRRRGPDASAVWRAQDANVCLGHTRLSIIDLSPAGSQPMVSAAGHHVLTFNGEIYNHAELRSRLGRSDLRGHSDTEVLLEALVQWGVDRTLASVNGMFAFGFWDGRSRRLTLARDRLGEKPLYLATGSGLVSFASDLEALRPVPGIDWDLDRDVVAVFLKRGFVSGGRSIHRGIDQLGPGEILEVELERGSELKRRRYWDPVPAASIELAVEQRADQLEELLCESIGLRSFADVPVGAFLSGGIDSSLVVALMRHACGTVRTFSIGFAETDMDEAPQARRIAEHLGTDHTEIYLGPDDALAVVPKLPAIYTEPFADPSQIPTFLVCSAARAEVTVALSGDGGDELFGGYDRYARAIALWRRFGAVPPRLRAVLGSVIGRVGAPTWSRLLRRPYELGKRTTAPPDLGHKVRRLGEVLGGDGLGTLYDDIFSLWPDAHRLVPGARPPQVIGGGWTGQDPLSWMTAADMTEYLPDDILVKVDRASMAVSLEVRVPLLDHRVVQFALAVPPGDKLVDGTGKQLLRRVLSRHVPPALFERPKMGFGAPIDRWLRGPLRAWGEDLLDRAALAEDNLLDPEPILRRWDEHQRGDRNWQYSLWAVLMLQQWRRHWAWRPSSAAGERDEVRSFTERASVQRRPNGQ